MLGVVVQVHPYGPGAGERGCRVTGRFSPRGQGRETENLTSRPAMAHQNFSVSPAPDARFRARGEGAILNVRFRVESTFPGHRKHC